MNKRYLLAVVAASAMSAATAGINSPDAAGCLERAQHALADANYYGCLDMIAEIDPATLTSDQTEQMFLAQALAAVHTDTRLAASLLEGFLLRFPQSAAVPRVTMALGDCYYGPGKGFDYAQALAWYSKVDPLSLRRSLSLDLIYRKAYCNLMLENYQDALAGFRQLDTEPYALASMFYRGYIAYALHDYDAAEKIFRGLNTNEAPANMADFYLSQIYFMRGDNTKALSMAKSLLKRPAIADEYVAEANRIAGEASYNLGEDAQAVKFLDKYVGMVAAPMPSALYILGVDCYNKGNYKQAIEYLSPVTENNDEMGQTAYLYMGEAFMHSNDYTEAALAFNRALNMDYNPAVQETAYYNYAVATMQGGKVPFASTVTIFSEFLKKFPRSRYAHNVQDYIITSYLTDNNYEAALNSINRMTDPSPATLAAKQRVLYALGNKALASAQYNQALEYLTQARALAAHDAGTDREVALSLGETYYRLGQYAKAVNEISKFIDNAPSNSPNLAIAYYDRGYALFAQKKYNDAITDFEKAVKTGSLPATALADAYNRLGDCYYNRINLPKAMDAYEKAYAQNPAAGDYSLFQMALVAGYSRDFGKKLSTLDRLQSEFPSSALIPDALLETTECYIQQGNNRKAIDVYRSLVERFPDTAQGRQGYLQMAVAMLNSGDRANAIETYKQVVRRYPSSDEALIAVDELKRLCANDGTLAQLMDFLKESPGAPKIDESDIERLTFDNAERLYLTENKMEKLEDFVDEFPESANRPRALAHLVEGEYNAGDMDAAYDYAKALVTQYPDNSFVLTALPVKALIEESRGQGNLAMRTWQTLAQKASSPATLLTARMGVIRTGIDSDNTEAVEAAADAVLASSAVGPDDLAQATFAKGLLLLKKGDFAAARKTWETVADNTDLAYGARSALSIGESFFNEKDYKSAENWARKIVDSDTPHQYYTARAFILLSDVFKARGENYKARQYLEAVRDNYTGNETDIREMIDQRLR